MIFQLILFALGMFLLIKGAEYFVKSSSNIAKSFGISEFLIGLTIVAIGTSLPELISTIFAAVKGQSEIITGAILGSNIANIGLILGITSLFAVIKTKKQMLIRDGYILVGTIVLFYLLILDSKLSALDASAFILIYLAYLLFLIKYKNSNKKDYKDFFKFFVKLRYISFLKENIILKKELTFDKKEISRQIMVLIISGIAIFFGAKFLIDQTIFFGNYLNIPKSIIALTAIALGTSLPELSVTISAAKKGYGNIAIGNIMGSCIANIILVLGVVPFILEVQISKMVLFYIAPMTLVFSFLLIFFIKKDHKIKKSSGIIFILLYVLFLISLTIIK